MNKPSPGQHTSGQRPFGFGLIFSVILHIAVLGLVVLGLPVFWEPEPLPEAIGVQLAQLSDITAAPKANKVNNEKIVKKPDAPKADQPKKEEPKKEAPPPNPQTAAPPPPKQEESKPTPTPPAPPKEEEAEKIPDPEKKPEEKKPEEKKPEEKKPEKKVEKKKPDEPKKKPDKNADKELDALLQNVLKDTPAPETQEKTKKKSAPAASEQSEGPQASQVSEIPLTASEEDGIRAQVEKNWNLGSLAGSPNMENILVEIRVTLQPDGTVTNAQVINSQSDPFFKQASESCLRAVRMSSPLKLPPGKTYNTMVLRFRPSEVSF